MEKIVDSVPSCITMLEGKMDWLTKTPSLIRERGFSLNQQVIRSLIPNDENVQSGACKCWGKITIKY